MGKQLSVDAYCKAPRGRTPRNSDGIRYGESAAGRSLPGCLVGQGDLRLEPAKRLKEPAADAYKRSLRHGRYSSTCID